MSTNRALVGLCNDDVFEHELVSLRLQHFLYLNDETVQVADARG